MGKKKHSRSRTKRRSYNKKRQNKTKRKSLRGGSRNPVLDIGSGLFKHINLSNSFFPNVLGNIKQNINYIIGGKGIFKNFNSNILNLGTK